MPLDPPSHSLLVVGSVGLDDVETRAGKRVNVLGGAASYFSVAASFLAQPRMVAIVGTDFPAEHTALFEKHGMKNEQYWMQLLTNLDDVKAKNTMIYIISHDSHQAAQTSWAAFRNDPEWHKARDESEKDGKIVEKVESVFMTLAEFSPKPK